MKGIESLGIIPKRLKTFMALKHPTGKWFRQNENEFILLMQSRMRDELGSFSAQEAVNNPISIAIYLGQRIEYQILNTSPMECMLENNTVADPKLYKLYRKAYREVSEVCHDIIQEEMKRLFGKGYWVVEGDADMTGVKV